MSTVLPSPATGDVAALARLKGLIGYLSLDAAPFAGGTPSAEPEPAQDRTWPGIVAAGVTAGLLPAVIDKLEHERDLDPAATADRLRQVGRLPEGLRYRRASQCTRLEQITAAWNAAGIEPLFMSSARDVWLGDNGWRFAVDLGAIIPPRCEAVAHDAAQRLGYQRVRALDRSGFRETWWCHAETNGNLVLRLERTNAAIERVLPARDLLACSRLVPVGRAVARVLPPPVDLLLEVLHQHYVTRAGAGTVTPKALYEFARCAARLSAEDLRCLWSLARAPEPRRVLTAWATTARCFGLRLVSPTDAHRSRHEPIPATARHHADTAFVVAPDGYRMKLQLPPPRRFPEKLRDWLVRGPRKPH